MIENSYKLKKKIDEFNTKFLSKDEIIIFEENRFDIIIGKSFNLAKKIMLITFKIFLNIFMKITEKFLDFLTQQGELKKKIQKQEEILLNNAKMNSMLAEQISLLNKKIEQGSFDAILTYWPYQARLIANGFKRVIDVTDIIDKLDVPKGLPIIGWVFRDEYSLENRDTLINFFNASEEAKIMMSESNEVWEKIKPSMNAENEETFLNLKEAYREGIPQEFAAKQIEGASKLFKTLSTIGGKELVGNSSEMADGTFWIK